jgi:hypothetical protein
LSEGGKSYVWSEIEILILPEKNGVMESWSNGVLETTLRATSSALRNDIIAKYDL